MSAETLRKAAALMRERAEAARAGRWIANGREVWAPWRVGGGYFVVAECVKPSVPEGAVVNALHIASWHPDVALAVAAWLDAEAHNADVGIGGRGFNSVGGQSDALAVATAYLGSDA